MYLAPIQAENVAQVFGWKSTYVSIEGRWSEKTERTSKIDLKQPSLSLSHHSDTPFLLRQRPSALGMLAREGGEKKEEKRKKEGKKKKKKEKSFNPPKQKGELWNSFILLLFTPEDMFNSRIFFNSASNTAAARNVPGRGGGNYGY